jgi:hypothetical protein
MLASSRTHTVSMTKSPTAAAPMAMMQYVARISHP